MKKVFLMGRSEAGKTSLTQASNSNEDTIDSPGEYAESKHFSVGLACFSFEADVIAIVQAANEPFNLFSDGSRNFLLRPLIGIITKVDSPYANLPMVRQWMENMGCERIFEVNNVTREGISELMDYLKDDLPKLTLEQAKFKQSSLTLSHVPAIRDCNKGLILLWHLDLDRRKCWTEHRCLTNGSLRHSGISNLPGSGRGCGVLLWQY